MPSQVRQIGAVAGSAFVIGFSGAVMPGPVLAATIPAALALGFLAGPLIVAGHGLVEVALLAGVASSLGRFLRDKDSQLVRGISVVGGLVLLLMGGLMLRDVPHLSLSLEAQGTEHGAENGEWKMEHGKWRMGVRPKQIGPSRLPISNFQSPISNFQLPLVAGAVLSLSNPYFFLWWATIGLGLVTQSLNTLGRPGVPIFYAGHILSDFVWYSFVAGAIAFGKDHLSDPLYRGLIVICALVLLFFGFRFLRDGWRPRGAMEERSSGVME